MKLYYVYILASRQRVLYIGITGNFERRIWEHQNDYYPSSFTARYKCHSLVYFEEFTDVTQAIAREKQLKGWRRGKKVRLIQSVNAHWADLSAPPALPGPSLRSG